MLDRQTLLKLVMEQAIAVVRRQRFERWLAEPEARPATETREDKR